ncbi:carbohydrate ABC transporter permease, partial [Streptococcus pneumoniae]|nr:carbohydrate ABC transporter permease [Streptococcus pneumoniae]
MKRFKPTTILEYILLTLLAGLFLFPMVWMVVSAMKPEADVYKNLTSWQAFLPSLNPADWFKPYQEVFERFSIFTYLGNSIF